MNPAFSLYLDLVRFSAACLVYMSHSNQRWLISDVLPASTLGHSAVVVFFVLSGFVIAYVTDTKERDWVSYSASRLARIYSVALPALLLTLILDSIGRQWLPAAYYYPYDQFLVRLVASALMLNEWWFISITTFSNVPYWSVTYEIWYYAAFGLVTFIHGRVKWVLAAVLLLALGPKILLLAPIWWLGVFLYHSDALRRLSLGRAWLFFLGSAIGIVLFHAFEISAQLSAVLNGAVGGELHHELTFSKFVLGDFILGPLVLLNFAGARRLLESAAATPELLSRLIRWAASFTFTLYLIHQPVFIFWGSALRGDPAGWAYWGLTTALTAGTVLVFSWATEARRYGLRQLFLRALTRIDVQILRRRGEIAF